LEAMQGCPFNIVIAASWLGKRSPRKAVGLLVPGPFVPKFIFSRFILSMTPFGVNRTERVTIGDGKRIGVEGKYVIP